MQTVKERDYVTERLPHGSLWSRGLRLAEAEIGVLVVEEVRLAVVLVVEADRRVAELPGDQRAPGRRLHRLPRTQPLRQALRHP